jgi:hypothetical protein
MKTYSHAIGARAVWSTAVLCLSAVPLFAQTSAQQPFRGSGNSAKGPDPKETLDLSVRVIEAYDDNLLADVAQVTPGSAAVGGFYSMFASDASYNWRGRRSQFGATGGTVVRYYNDTRTFNTSGTAGIGFSTELARRTSLFANQSVAYSPSYLYGLFPTVTTVAPGDAIPVAPDYAVNDSGSYSYATTVSLTQGIARRAQMTGTVSYHRTNFIHATETRHDLTASQAEVTFAHNLARNTSLKVGYHYRVGDFGASFGSDGRTTEHGVDVGAEYVHPLSPTRRVVLSFNMGSAAAEMATGTADAGAGRQYRVLGDVALGYQFRRTWETRVSYRRGFNYVPDLAEPVFTNGVSAALNGFLTRRMDMSLTAGYSRGESAVFTRSALFDTYTAGVRVRHALNRMWGLYGEYVYYFYDFGQTTLSPGVPSKLERNGIRGGLTLWLPVVRR